LLSCKDWVPGLPRLEAEWPGMTVELKD
jgi:hypothetical protein